MLGPTGFRGLGSYFRSFRLGHGLEPTLPADLPTFTAYGGRVRGKVRGGRSGDRLPLLLLHSWSDLQSTWQAGLGREGVFLCRLSSRCGSFNPELHCCYEVGIHKTPRHHNTGDRDGGFDPSDDTCLPGYLRPLTRLYDATKRDAQRDAHRRGKIAQ
jgi:hypothetical protein